MNKYIEQVNKGKDPKVVILEMYHKIEDLKNQLTSNASAAQLKMIKLENRIDELEKENLELRSKND